MKIGFECHACGKKFSVDESLSGKRAKCLCGEKLTVPEPEVALAALPGAERWGRINAQLQEEKGVPVFPAPLWTNDGDESKLRSAQEMAQRIYPLWAVSIRGEGIPLQELWEEFLDYERVWPWTTPEEQRFLIDPNPDPDEARNLVWRLESIWVLLWCLDLMSELPYPDSMCNVPEMMSVLSPLRDDDGFIANAKRRSAEEIFDEHERTVRLHWASRDAYLNNRQVPANFDWINPSEMISPAPTLVGRLLEERHHVFNWVVGFDDSDWDDIDTPT